MALRRLALPRHSVQIDKHLSDSPKKSQNHAVSTESDKDISGKVEKIIKGSLVSIPSPSPSVKNQIIGGKVYLK